MLEIWWAGGEHATRRVAAQPTNYYKLHTARIPSYANRFPGKSTRSASLIMKKFGLFIGVDAYRELNAPEQRLECAGADATALSAFFQRELGFQTELLLDKHLGLFDQGSHQAIIEQLNHWQDGLQRNEEHLLLVYFAGHGSDHKGEHFLLAPKAPKHALHDPVDGELGIISESMLKRVSARWPNVKRIFIFDTCRAQLTAPEMAAIASRVALGEAQEVEKAPEPNLLVLRACAPRQLAFELREFGVEKKNHGLYTAALLQVLQQRLKDEQSLELNFAINQTLHAQMQQLATLHAPPEYQAQALAQRPCLTGEPICLLSEQEIAANKLQRVLQEFEQRFAVGHYHEPTMQCCAESLRQLRALKYAESSLQLLGEKLDAAVHAQRATARKSKGEKLLALARRTQSPDAYLKLLEQEFHEYEEEVEQFFAIRDSERSALQAKASSAERLAVELQEAQQQNKKISAEKEALKQELMQQVSKLTAENTELKLEIKQKMQQTIQQKPEAQPAPVIITPVAPAIINSARKAGATFQEPLQGGKLGPQMVLVPAGSFQLGSDLEADERFGPQVTIAQPFALGKFQVTVEEYLAAVEAKACRAPAWLEQGSEYHYANGHNDLYRKLGEALYGKRFPIVGVSWDDAQAYVAWLNSTKLGKQGGQGQYRLPSEAEWEYAARAGNAGKWCFGDDESKLQDFAWYSKNSDNKTHEVGGKQANKFGLHDMHGNVWEWVADEHHQNYLGAPKDGSVWQDGDIKDKFRVLRGGSWVINAAYSRSANRNYYGPDNRFNDVGFRVARTLP